MNTVITTSPKKKTRKNSKTTATVLKFIQKFKSIKKNISK